jgi:hypothetical protein
MKAGKEIIGNCLCGAVEFSAGLPSKWCAHCHCSMCRKHHGAGYVTWVGFDQDQVRFLRGADCLGWYISSAGAQRGFCRQCGSSMFFRSERWAGELHIVLGCINGAIDRQPEANVFFDNHVDWMPIDESLKKVDG